MRAADEGHTDCVRLLIEGGANKHKLDNVRGMPYFFSLPFLLDYLKLRSFPGSICGLDFTQISMSLEIHRTA